MKKISDLIKLVAVGGALVFGAIAIAQTGTSGTDTGGIGDYTYQTRVTSRCSTASGTTAACSNIAPSTPNVVFYKDSSLRQSSVPPNSVEGAFCGNGICDANESTSSCASDCGGADPSGVGPQIGEGACSSQRFIKTYPAAGMPTGKTALCYLSFKTGTGTFSQRRTYTTSSGFLPEGDNCSNGTPPKGTLTLICANGSWLEDKATCACN